MRKYHLLKELEVNTKISPPPRRTATAEGNELALPVTSEQERGGGREERVVGEEAASP